MFWFVTTAGLNTIHKHLIKFYAMTAYVNEAKRDQIFSNGAKHGQPGPNGVKRGQAGPIGVTIHWFVDDHPCIGG